MEYGVMIIEEDGRNWAHTYQPFNMIDQLTISERGVRTYVLAPTEQLVLAEGQTYGGQGANISVSAVGNQVRWPISNSAPLASGEHRVVVPPGASVLVLKKR